MKTNQIMTRNLFSGEIYQRTEDGFFLMSSVVNAGDKWRRDHGLSRFNATSFLSQKSTTEFVSELSKKLGYPCVVHTGSGRASKTWLHPFVMLEIAFAMSPELKVEVYSWIYDELIKYRTDSGDSYKKMCGALYVKFSNVRTFPHFIADTANQIREACMVEDWNKASEQQLKLRDKIHDTISIAADFTPDPRAAVAMGIAKVKRELWPKST